MAFLCCFSLDLLSLSPVFCFWFVKMRFFFLGGITHDVTPLSLWCQQHVTHQTFRELFM